MSAGSGGDAGGVCESPKCDRHGRIDSLKFLHECAHLLDQWWCCRSATSAASSHKVNCICRRWWTGRRPSESPNCNQRGRFPGDQVVNTADPDHSKIVTPSSDDPEAADMQLTACRRWWRGRRRVRACRTRSAWSSSWRLSGPSAGLIPWDCTICTLRLPGPCTPQAWCSSTPPCCAAFSRIRRAPAACSCVPNPMGRFRVFWSS